MYKCKIRSFRIKQLCTKCDIVLKFFQFASFEALTKLTYKPDGSRTLEHFVSGAGAGTVATVVSYPFDIIRTRFIAQGNKKVSGFQQKRF